MRVRVREAGKWALAIVAVITFPLWVLPYFFGFALWDAVVSFKRDVLDEPSDNER